MANAQIKRMVSRGYYSTVEKEVLTVITSYSSASNPMDSYKIYNHVSPHVKMLVHSCIKPNSGGYSVPESWIGSVAANLSNHGRIHRKRKNSIHKGKKYDSWHI